MVTDFKQLVAGENSDRPQRRDRMSNENSSRDFSLSDLLGKAILHLQAISGRQLTDLEEPFWKEKLSKYHPWKLEILIEDYSGPFNDKVIGFLDSLKQNPKDKSFHALPEPKPNDRQIEISRAWSEHRRIFLAGPGQLSMMTTELKKQRRKAEFESLKFILSKYPECGSIDDDDVKKRFAEFY